MANECVFCKSVGGELLWQDALCRVVLVDDPQYVGFCRVILNKHLKEMTDLNEIERARVMRVTFAVERTLRDVLQPDKINKTPHIHWHVIPRFSSDPHFPETIWSAEVRETEKPTIARLKDALQAKLDNTLSAN
jgi:diadenosine tetraphosphate (Ap4A) HIT family hydrolase